MFYVGNVGNECERHEQSVERALRNGQREHAMLGQHLERQKRYA